MKKILGALLSAFVLTMMLGITVFAKGTDQPVIALGADLSAEQRATVLNYMGISEADLVNYQVVTITNADEREYLSDYIDAELIGTRALSSVVVTPAEAGHGVVVTTQNINYCTTDMYRNALLTAGVKDADIMVVAPTQLSGTAGLIGAVKAYEDATGEEISDAAFDAALDEMITTGDIVQKSASDEEVEELIAYIKAKIAAGECENEDDIRKVIEEGMEKFNVSLTEDEIQKIIDVMMKVNELGLDPNVLLDQAKDLYDKFGDELLIKVQDEGFWGGIGNFFSAIADFFASLFNF